MKKKQPQQYASNRPRPTAGQRQGIRDRKARGKYLRAREQETMPPEEIDERITKAIVEAVEQRGAVTRADLLATNVPPASIDARFKHCMALAEEREPRLRHMMREAA